MGHQSRRRRSELRRLAHAKSSDECRINIARSFRRMLVRADLRERPDARPGPPRREPAEAIAEPSPPTRPYDRLLGPMVRSVLRITIRSGELIVGLLSRSTHGPEAWSWTLTGVRRPDDEDFIWHGDAETDHDAFDQIALAWAVDLVGRSRIDCAAPARRASRCAAAPSRLRCTVPAGGPTALDSRDQARRLSADAASGWLARPLLHPQRP